MVRIAFRSGNSPTMPARICIARKIRTLIREGVPQNVAVARGFDECRRAGFRSIPKIPTRRDMRKVRVVS